MVLMVVDIIGASGSYDVKTVLAAVVSLQIESR